MEAGIYVFACLHVCWAVSAYSLPEWWLSCEFFSAVGSTRWLNSSWWKEALWTRGHSLCIMFGLYFLVYEEFRVKSFPSNRWSIRTLAHYRIIEILPSTGPQNTPQESKNILSLWEVSFLMLGIDKLKLSSVLSYCTSSKTGGIILSYNSIPYRQSCSVGWKLTIKV